VRGQKLIWNSLASILLQTFSASLIVMLGTATRNFIVAPFVYLPAMAATWFTLEVPQEADAARRKQYEAQMGRASDHPGPFRRAPPGADC